MKYADGSEVKLGDTVRLSDGTSGKLVADIGAGAFLQSYPRQEWSYLRTGFLLETDFAGLVYFPDIAQQVKKASSM